MSGTPVITANRETDKSSDEWTVYVVRPYGTNRSVFLETLF